MDMDRIPDRARDAWVRLTDISASRLGCMIANPDSCHVRKAIELIRESEEQDVELIVKALAKVQA